MATLLFDFDSTLVRCESLEVLLAKHLRGQPDKMQAIEDLTNQAMNGEMPFAEALEQRLRIAAPTQQDIRAFCQDPEYWLTEGMAECIQSLYAQYDIWIISGGIKEVILPFADYLHIPADHVHAAQLHWDAKGNFAGINQDEPFSHSKKRGAEQIAPQWQQHPVIMIGDGMSDYEIFACGLAQHFIAYTEHAARPAVDQVAIEKAPSPAILLDVLQRLT